MEILIKQSLILLRKLLSILGVGIKATAMAGGAEFYKPYAASHVNSLYNLLFCDDLSLFHKESKAKDVSPWATLFTENPDYAALEGIAQNQDEESRVRVLAYNRLRAAGRPVPAKKLLGVIVEVALPQGLDVLAAYPDGRARYLNQSGKVAIFEGGPPEVVALAKELVTTSQALVNKIGPWEKNRLPPPRTGNVRLTFLASDGLYFGEGPFQVLQKDPLGGPVLSKTIQLLQIAVKAGLK